MVDEPRYFDNITEFSTKIGKQKVSINNALLTFKSIIHQFVTLALGQYHADWLPPQSRVA